MNTFIVLCITVGMSMNTFYSIMYYSSHVNEYFILLCMTVGMSIKTFVV